MMTDPTVTMYRIYWRIGANGQLHRGTATFERELAELWVNNLNADRDNKAVGVFYWMEAEPAEGNGRGSSGGGEGKRSCV